MSGYMVEMKIRCDDCTKPARYVVFNRYNAKAGQFCALHAKRKVKAIDEAAKTIDRLQAEPRVKGSDFLPRYVSASAARGEELKEGEP